MSLQQVMVPAVINTWGSRIACIISILITLILLIHHKWKLNQYRKPIPDPEKRSLSTIENHKCKGQTVKIKRLHSTDSSDKSISFTIISSFIFIMLSTITLSGCILVSYFNHCSSYPPFYQSEIFTIGIGYALTKLSYYILLSYRIEESFQSSSYSYNIYMLWLWRIFLLFGVCLFIIFFILYSHTIRCMQHIPFWILIYGALFDFIASIINLILFTRQLWSFAQDCPDDNPNGKQNTFVQELQFINKKQVLLATISITTTILCVINMSIFGMPVIWISLDLLITNICIVLMFSWNKKYFQFCCGRCLHKIINDNMIERIALSSTSRHSSNKSATFSITAYSQSNHKRTSTLQHSSRHILSPSITATNTTNTTNTPSSSRRASISRLKMTATDSISAHQLEPNQLQTNQSEHKSVDSEIANDCPVVSKLHREIVLAVSSMDSVRNHLHVQTTSFPMPTMSNTASLGTIIDIDEEGYLSDHVK